LGILMSELKSHYFENFKKLPALQKVSLFSVLFLVVMLPLGVLLALGPVNLFPKAGVPTVTPPNPITPPNSNTTAWLVLAPLEMVRQANMEFDLSVLINSADHAISGAEVIIDFDPDYLEAESVIPAAGSGSLSVVLEEPQINNETGRITIAQGAQPNSLVGGPSVGVAAIHFKTKTQGGDTYIRANSDSRASAVGVDGNVLGRFDTVSVEVLAAPSPTPILPSPTPQGTVDVQVNIYNTAVLLGEEFGATVYLNNGDSLSMTAAEIHVSFDKNYLEALNVNLNSHSGLVNVLAEPVIDNNNGTVSFTVGASPDLPVTSSANLATINFKAKNNRGLSRISVVEPTQVAVVGSRTDMVGRMLFAEVNVSRDRDTFFAFVMKLDGVTRSVSNKIVRVTIKGGTLATTHDLPISSYNGANFTGDLFDNISIINYSGDLTIYAKGPSHLQRRITTINRIIPGENTIDATNLPLIPGDIVDDNEVNIDDYNVLVRHFGSRMPVEGSLADLNFDGRVDIFDYNLIIRHFGKTGDNVE